MANRLFVRLVEPGLADLLLLIVEDEIVPQLRDGFHRIPLTSFYVFARTPATAISTPPQISTMLMIGERRSLWVVCTPKLTSPALIPCVSVLRIGMTNEAIPKTSRSMPTYRTFF